MSKQVFELKKAVGTVDIVLEAEETKNPSARYML